MAVNQKNVTIASINYLVEVSAIPSDIRNDYLKKLLKRKNSARRKNIRLLIFIYHYVNENRLSEWDPAEVCKQIGLNLNSLYIQKSRLLKGLREYYFKWKETEKEIKISVNKKYEKGSTCTEQEKIISFMLEKARKMVKIGMRREARYLYIKLEKFSGLPAISQTERALIQSEIYDYLCYYYFNKRHKKKVLYYSGKLKELTEQAQKSDIKATDKQKALFDIRYNYSMYYHYAILWYVNPKTVMAADYSGTVYRIAKEFNFSFYLQKVLHSMAVLELTRGNFKKAKEICTEGYNTAKKIKEEAAQYTFASMLYFIKMKTGSNNPELNNGSIVSCYHKIKSSSPYNLWTIYLENSIVMTYYPDKEKEILEVFREQIASNIMFGDFAFSVFWKFLLDLEMYNDKILSFFNKESIERKGYMEMGKIDENILDDIKKICLNTECYHKKINDFGLMWIVSSFKLTSFFFREEGFDYNEVTDALKNSEHLRKKSEIKPSLKTYEIVRLGLSMMEHDDNKAYMLDKYELKFKRAIEHLKENLQDYTIMD